MVNTRERAGAAGHRAEMEGDLVDLSSLLVLARDEMAAITGARSDEMSAVEELTRTALLLAQSMIDRLNPDLQHSVQI